MYYQESIISFWLELMPSDSSFVYIRKRKGPNIEPWATPAFIAFIGDCVQFRFNLSFWIVKKFWKTNSNLPKISFI